MGAYWWLLPLGDFNSQSCPYQASDNLSITVSGFPIPALAPVEVYALGFLFRKLKNCWSWKPARSTRKWKTLAMTKYAGSGITFLILSLAVVLSTFSYRVAVQLYQRHPPVCSYVPQIPEDICQALLTVPSLCSVLFPKSNDFQIWYIPLLQINVCATVREKKLDCSF